MAFTRGSVVVLVCKHRKDVRCTSVAQSLKTLRADTLWEREIGDQYFENGYVLLHPCYETDSELCLAIFCRASSWFGAAPDGSCLLAHGLVFGDRDARVATGTWGWWRMVLVLLLANCELTSNVSSLFVLCLLLRGTHRLLIRLKEK